MDNILTTRTFYFSDPKVEPNGVRLTIFKPTQENTEWRMAFSLATPLQWTRDFVFPNVAFLLMNTLKIISAYLQGMGYYGRIHWQERMDCGLPDTARRPDSYTPPDLPPLEKNPRNLEVFATAPLPYPDEHGVETADELIIFLPTQQANGHWACGFTFESPDAPGIRYGTGDDFIEAFLDALAMARLIHEPKVPAGWKSQALIGCERLPYKIGRSYYLDEREKER